MKAKRNNKLYVELNDIFDLQVLPIDVINELPEDISTNYIVFESEKAINFFDEQEWILDYDVVKDLTEDEIEKILDDLNNKFDTLCKLWLNSSQEYRKNYLENSESINQINNLKKQIKAYNKLKSLKINNAFSFNEVSLNKTLVKI